MTKAMPPKLAAALIGVAREVKQLGKSERNKFANYDFVSVDKFYAVVGGLMAEGGVLCIPDCIESEVLPGHVKYDKDGTERRGAPLLRERWAFTLIHESGETYEHPVHRTVTVPAEGAQAHGSSESYAQKQFLRGVFRVPTGDKDDADYQAPQTHAQQVIGSEAAIALQAEIDAVEADLAALLRYFGVDALPMLTEDQAKAARAMLAKKKAAKS
jgi:hypothetical protein